MIVLLGEKKSLNPGTSCCLLNDYCGFLILFFAVSINMGYLFYFCGRVQIPLI